MTPVRMPRRAFMAGAVTAAMAPAGQARAAWLPTQPIRVLVGYPPGGAVDILVRVVGEGAQRLRGVQLVPEIRSGAYGFIAAQTAARAAPDGTTLCSAIMGMMSVLPAIPGIPVPLDLDRELTPVSALAGTPMALVVRPDAPFGDVDGLIAYAKSRNGAATYASSGNGSINHLGAALFCGATGVQMTHIPYRGGAPATLDVSAGRVDMMVANVAEVAQQIVAGQLKGVGVTAREPTSLMPGLAPLASRIPALEINNWFGLAGPANMPTEVRTGLGEMFNAVVNDPQTAKILTERGLLPLGAAGSDFEQRILRDRARWKEVVQANNIRGD
ncbi:Bug family tripartite tricarboxylate transporter substrate binding protein [Muricoccus aerilatus]|uniref:Bug family tripartite tricarboxylate transporter substrate binding protein n=1 Tax=Muricoccus aerilatus TaxID=452982 RepID=UPI000B269CD6|nr:tripartite tricarboxylate transporter substrate binding protein [Roseomonas aerilata]